MVSAHGLVADCAQDENNPCFKPFTTCWRAVDWKSLKSEPFENAQSDKVCFVEPKRVNWGELFQISKFGFCAVFK